MNARQHNEFSVIDLRKPPTVHSQPEPIELTIGDLHANALKLIYYLISNDILRVKEDKDKTKDDIYLEIVDAYEKYKNDRDSEKFFREFINLLENSCTINNDPSHLIRLIGDELFDRGANDFFILKCLEMLDKNNIRTEILISNHGSGFVAAMFNDDFVDVGNAFGSYLGYLKTKKIILSDERNVESSAQEIARKHYLPKLKIVSYSLSPDGKNIKIYSHAPIDLDIIRYMAEELKIPYQADTARALAETIDKINQKVQQDYIQQNKLGELLHGKYDKPQLYTKEIDGKNHPFLFSIWNRNYAILNRNEQAKQAEYGLHFVHGHDDNQINLDNTHATTLDDALGKSNLDPEEGRFMIDSAGVNLQAIESHTSTASISSVSERVVNNITQNPTFEENMADSIDESPRQIDNFVFKKDKAVDNKIKETDEIANKPPISGQSPSISTPSSPIINNTTSADKLAAEKVNKRIQELEKPKFKGTAFAIFNRLCQSKTKKDKIVALKKLQTSLENNRDETVSEVVNRWKKDSFDKNQKMEDVINKQNFVAKISKHTSKTAKVIEDLEENKLTFKK